jgi:hypothetical protein
MQQPIISWIASEIIEKLSCIIGFTNGGAISIIKNRKKIVTLDHLSMISI